MPMNNGMPPPRGFAATARAGAASRSAGAAIAEADLTSAAFPLGTVSAAAVQLRAKIRAAVRCMVLSGCGAGDGAGEHDDDPSPTVGRCREHGS
mmetsp:Transcript_14688/g.45509  ORF Transcript_14688/g.45509 Transcript_14688/m.45509 type:complete len:94 (+) Transcript_14688:1011-1292(+)